MADLNFELPETNPAHRADLRAAILAMPVSSLLGLRVLGFAPGLSVIELDLRPELTFDGRTAQGGVVGTLADFAGVSAATATLPDGGRASTSGFEVHLLAPARGTRLVAVGRVAHAGTSSAVSKVEVHAVNEAGQAGLVAIATTTCRLFPAVPG